MTYQELYVQFPGTQGTTLRELNAFSYYKLGPPLRYAGEKATQNKNNRKPQEQLLH